MTEKEHLLRYFTLPDKNLVLTEMMAESHLSFNPWCIPDVPRERIRRTNGKKLLEFAFESDLPDIYSSRLLVPLEELRKEQAVPWAVEQEALLSSIDSALSISYTYRYLGTEFNTPGVLQHLDLHLPLTVSPEIAGVDLTRRVIDQVCDLRFATVWLQDESENYLKKLVGLSDKKSVELTLIPGYILLSEKGSAHIITELKESDLQKLGMNGSLQDTKEEMKVNIVSNSLAISLELGKKLRVDYPSFMFSRSSKETRIITEYRVWSGFVEYVDLN